MRNPPTTPPRAVGPAHPSSAAGCTGGGSGGGRGDFGAAAGEWVVGGGQVQSIRSSTRPAPFGRRYAFHVILSPSASLRVDSAKNLDESLTAHPLWTSRSNAGQAEAWPSDWCRVARAPAAR